MDLESAIQVAMREQNLKHRLAITGSNMNNTLSYRGMLTNRQGRSHDFKDQVDIISHQNWTSPPTINKFKKTKCSSFVEAQRKNFYTKSDVRNKFY